MSAVDLLVQEIRKLSREEVKELLAKVTSIQRTHSQSKDIHRYVGIGKGLTVIFLTVAAFCSSSRCQYRYGLKRPDCFEPRRPALYERLSTHVSFRVIAGVIIRYFRTPFNASSITSMALS